MLDELKSYFVNQGFECKIKTDEDGETALIVSNGYHEVAIKEITEGCNEGFTEVHFENGTFDFSEDIDYIKNVVESNL